MDAPSKQCVIDANVLMDFHKGRILHTLVGTDFNLITTDFVGSEMISPNPADIETTGVSIYSLDETQMVSLFKLASLYPKVSVADLSTLVLAKHLKIILLTGDNDLKKVAQGMNVEVHGAIWILDHLIENGSLAKRVAKTALIAMVKQKSRFPVRTYEKRIAEWSSP